LETTTMYVVAFPTAILAASIFLRLLRTSRGVQLRWHLRRRFRRRPIRGDIRRLSARPRTGAWRNGCVVPTYLSGVSTGE
jgi:hypothetical protein